MHLKESSASDRNRDIAGSVLLIAVVLLTYLPALHGGLQWDDPAHLTRAELQPWSGLWKIWFVPGSTQQYYPMLHSAFWLLHHLFGDDTLGYHLVTATLHGVAAGLLWRVLRRAGILGGYLAAVIFALHPVQVESVAWMSELKNTLSGVCYFAAALCYLRFDESRERRWYGAALVIFLIGLLTKTVIATLPAALLLLFWWRRGSLDLRRDVRPTIPFFLIGGLAGITTAIVEVQLVGARDTPCLGWTLFSASCFQDESSGSISARHYGLPN